MNVHYNDRARRVMQLANQEAQRFNHEYIGTEHVLLALIKEGGGIAAHVLRSLGVPPQHLRLEVEKRMQSGPELVSTMGRFPQTPKLKGVVEFAIEEAKLDNRTEVETADLLVALLRDSESVAAQALLSLGITLVKVRLAVKATEERKVRRSEDGKILLRRVAGVDSLDQEGIAEKEKQMLGELLERRGWSTYTAASALLLLEVFDVALKDKEVKEPCPALVVFLELLSNAQSRPMDDQPWRAYFEALAQEVKKVEEVGDKWKELYKRLS